MAATGFCPVKNKPKEVIYYLNYLCVIQMSVVNSTRYGHYYILCTERKLCGFP